MAEIVYVLSNESMPGLVKIGLTTREDPLQRLQELFTTGVPTPFECVGAWFVPNARSAEASLHAHFRDYRVNPAREFFRVEKNDVLEELSKMGHEEVTDKLQAEIEAENRRSFKRRPNQNWFEMGYKAGDQFSVGNTGELLTVVDGRLLEYRGRHVYLTEVRKILKEKYPGQEWDHRLHMDGKLMADVYDETYGPIGS